MTVSYDILAIVCLNLRCVSECMYVSMCIDVYLYLYRRVCVCLCVYPSKHIYVAVCGPIGTKFGTHMQIHLEKVVGKIKNCPVWYRGHMGGFRGQKLKNGGNLPNGWTDWHQIWHTYADSSENEHRLKNNYPLKTTGSILRGLCGQKLKPGKCGVTAGLIVGCCFWPS